MFPADSLFPRPIYQVSDLLKEVSTALSSGWRRISVAGQACNVRPHRTGHVWFSLKDEKGKLSAVMWQSDAARVPFRLEEGIEVVATGTLCLYAPQGQFQLQVANLSPVGVGSLQLAFEQTRRRLAEEGLFDEARKRPLPALPKRIGIVTSPDGAAIRDILTVLRRRHPNLWITVFPSRVQGDGSALELAEGIRCLSRLPGVDVLILARGGGSAEDLAPFNDERVVRALASSAIPTISAVGHETDWTLCDSAADLRAATPSAAAELVVGVQEQIAARVASARQELVRIARRQILDLRRRIEWSVGRLRERMDVRLERTRSRLDRAAEKLGALDPVGVLKRGYAIVYRDGSEAPVRSTAGLTRGTPLRVVLADGGLRVAVTGISGKEDA
jgi:exodeoxyribonuclease VII large subunit